MTTFDLITAGSSYLCSYCAAGVGEPCRTKTGGRATYMHVARSQPLWRAWNAGYSDALRDVANNPGWWGRARHRYLNKETPMSTIAAVLFPHDLVDDDEYDRLTRYACCDDFDKHSITNLSDTGYNHERIESCEDCGWEMESLVNLTAAILARRAREVALLCPWISGSDTLLSHHEFHGGECPFEAASNLIKRQAKETPRRLEIP